MKRVLPIGLAVLAVSVALAVGQGPQRKSSSGEPPIQALRCRMSLFKDQAVACGRAGVLDFVGLQVEDGQTEDGQPKYKVIELTEGMEVKEGDIIAQLEADVPKATYLVAKTEAENDVEIRFQKKAAEVAQAAYDLAVQANRTFAKTYPELEVKKLKLDWDKGELATEQAEHQFKILKMKAEEAHAVLETYRIRAPFDGIITHTLKSKGEAVREGDPILEMANTHRVRVEGYVAPRDAQKLRRGMKVLVQQEGDSGTAEERQFEGTVLFVDVQLEKVTLMQRVVAEVVNNDGGLIAGRQATMTFVTASTAAK